MTYIVNVGQASGGVQYGPAAVRSRDITVGDVNTESIKKIIITSFRDSIGRASDKTLMWTYLTTNVCYLESIPAKRGEYTVNRV